MESKNTSSANSLTFYTISPKEDCPHLESLKFNQVSSDITREILGAPCKDCNSTQENWMCLQCYNIYCSRYINSHMIRHYENTKHHVTLGLADGSFWCYTCDSYVYSKELHALALQSSKLRFPRLKGDFIDLDTLAKKLSSKDIHDRAEEKEESSNFSRKKLVNGLKTNAYKRIILLTGAGISVSAGIPDFRSETGIYAQLGESNLPFPEAIFELGYFKENPETFYKLAKILMNFKAKPTAAHYFIKILADSGSLLMDFTQNVDGLEVVAGIDPKYLVEAHGHLRSAHCSGCRREKPINELENHIKEGKVYYCECNAPIKPDIIFFGEQLPNSFFTSFQQISQADLVIVMGTSLRVFPFASLVHSVPKETPIVLINKENTAISRDNFLFMQGDIDEQIISLIKEIGWKAKFDELKSKHIDQPHL